jgi:hypothetical protein
MASSHPPEKLDKVSASPCACSSLLIDISQVPGSLSQPILLKSYSMSVELMVHAQCFGSVLDVSCSLHREPLFDVSTFTA